MNLNDLVPAMTGRLPVMLADIEQLVHRESPSADLAAVAASADVMAAIGEGLLGTAPERIVADGVTHLRWKLGSASGASGPAKVLLLGHHDTVWPLGSLETHPFSVDDGVLRGPGCFDMKTGLVLALHAVAGAGTPTLDGLGAVGGGAHADHEHVLVAELPGRAALLTALVHDLLGEPA